MGRRTWRARAACLLALAAILLGGGAARAGPEQKLEADRRALMEAREKLAAALGAERNAEVQAAQAEVTELKPWLSFFRDLELSEKLDGSDTQTLKKMEAAVRSAESALEGWRRDDANKGQGEGPQTLQAAADLEAARERLARFKSSLLDEEVARVSSFAAEGIGSFDELERRYRESEALLADVKKESGEIGNLVRKIENLERGIATLEVTTTGKAVFRLEYVLRRPRGYWEHSIPQDVTPNGGSWTRAEADRRSFKVKTHAVYHQDYEDWDFQLTVGGLESTVTVTAGGDGQMFLELDVSGECSVGGNVPEDRLSGQGVLLDARAGGAFSRFGQGAVGVGLKNRSAQEKFRFRVSPGYRQAYVHLFLWNIPVGVTCVYRRE